MAGKNAKNTVIPHWELPTLAVAGSGQRFPVRRIFCVGRNYAAHAREMGRDPSRELPFFFTKFPDSIVENGATISYPVATANYQHEIELVVAIGREGFRIPSTRSKDYIYGYGVGLDMTRRDLQQAAREQGRPWDSGKNFPESAPMTILYPSTAVGHPETGAIWLKVDDEVRQNADLSQMIWNTEEIIQHLSGLYRLQPGDLIMTGTPAGVGPIEPGQTMIGHVDGFDELIIHVSESVV